MLNVACISFSLGNAKANSGVVTSRQATLVATSNSTRGGAANVGDDCSHTRAATTIPVARALSRTRSNRQQRTMDALLRARRFLRSSLAGANRSPGRQAAGTGNVGLRK